MIKTHRSPGLTAALVCGVLLSSALFVFAQDKKPENKTEDDGNGGKITTTYSTHDGKNVVEKVHKNAQGKLLNKLTETSGPDGRVEEEEVYDRSGNEQMTCRRKSEQDGSGKIIGGQFESYKDGTLIEGEIWVVKEKPGEPPYTATVKKWSNLKGKYVDVPLEEQERRHEEAKKLLEEDRKKREANKTIMELNRSGKVSYESSGTGETIGHVVDLKIQNLTDEPLDMIIPPLIVESSNAENQDDVCPHEKSVMIVSRQTETVPLDGVCINRDKPPVAKGLTGALVLNMAEPDIAQHSNCHIPAKAARDLLRICSSIYDAVDKLENDGAFKDFPYRDKQEQKNIAIQWIVWSDPRICEITGGKPVTKEDFDKVVYKQVEQREPVTPQTRKKIDKGDDAMWNGIQLASAKAKDLENREDAGPPPSVVNVADNAPAPAPKTETVPQGSPPPEKPAGQDKTGPNDDLPKESYDALDKARRNYLMALFQFESKLSVDLKALRDDLYNPEIQSSPDYKKKLATYSKLLVDVPKEFTKTKEGKKLLDQWLETYEKAYKTGKKVPQFLVPDTADPYLKPVAKGDEIANKTQALSSAQLDLEKENTKYSQMQKDAVANSDAVKKFEAQIEKEYGKGIQADTGKLKQLQADMENAGKQVAKDWASTDEAKDQMKKVQQAEKDLDKAKEAYKPYEQLKEKPAKQTKP